MNQCENETKSQLPTRLDLTLHIPRSCISLATTTTNKKHLVKNHKTVAKCPVIKLHYKTERM